MRLLLAFAFVALAISVKAQKSTLQGLYKSASNSSSLEMAQAKLNAFINEQAIKKSQKTELHFLSGLVKSTHQQFLKHYKPYVSINEPFETGEFDCLTGTAVFSIIFTELGIHHKIIETNYHIFLMIDGQHGKILLETTDKLFGLKTKQSEIEKCLSSYQQNLLTTASSGYQYYRYKNDLFKEILPFQILGLLYFNQAVVAFNSHDLATCINRLELAHKEYNNPRIKELVSITAQAVSTSLLSEKEKYSLLVQLATFEEPMIASR